MWVRSWLAEIALTTVAGGVLVTRYVTHVASPTGVIAFAIGSGAVWALVRVSARRYALWEAAAA